ncbi:MAG: uL22 family ribosomal protein [Candidatus Daviesbacteria bacterium]|nr:uL22 family ribosomal protein [Candidatus Daviesbacteria bacterium]
MEITSIQKNITTSPRKVRLVADMVRKMTPDKSLEMLGFTNKAASLQLSKAIKTALANARAQGIPTLGLTFKALEINEGMRMKRVMSGGRGRTRQYERQTSHIKIVLTDEVKVIKESTKKEARSGTKN